MTLRALAISSLLVVAACETIAPAGSAPTGPAPEPIPDGPLVLGRIDYRERELLPTPATLEVDLIRVDTTRGIETTLGSWKRLDPGSVPIKFWIPYVLDDIDPAASYVVRARVDDEVGRLWQTTKRFDVELPTEVSRIRAAREEADSPSTAPDPGAADDVIVGAPDGAADGAAVGAPAGANDGTAEVDGAAEEELEDTSPDTPADTSTGPPADGEAAAAAIEVAAATTIDREWLDIGRVVLTRVPRRRPPEPEPSSAATAAPPWGIGATGAVAGEVRPGDAPPPASSSRDSSTGRTAPPTNQPTGSAPPPPPPPPVDPDPVVVRGRVFRRPGAIPAGSTLFVRLVERPADGGDDRVVRETSFDELPNAPIDFVFRLEVTDIDLAGDHRITAEVLGPDGGLLHRTTGRYGANIPPEGGDVEAGQVLLREVPR